MSRTYAAVRQVSNSYLVRERDRRRRRELGTILLRVTPIGILLLVLIWFRVETLRAGYQIDALEQELHEQLRIERQLRLRESQLSRPQRIDLMAMERLGMHPPEVAQLVALDDLLAGGTPLAPEEARP